MKVKKEVRVICVKQPWAWFIVNGYKDIENRNNHPRDKFIGERVYIHASASKVTKANFEKAIDDAKAVKAKNFPKSKDDFIYGAIIGSVVIKSSSRSSKSFWAFKGNCHWLLEKAQKIKPVFMKGQQALFFKAKI